MLQAIFLDRDGVLNRERPDYVKSWQEFEVLPGILPALARLAALGRPILVISNQSAIGRGLMTSATLDALHQRFKQLVEENGGRIDAFYVCPHRPDEGCSCRKPKPGLLHRAAQDYHLDLERCLFIGDSITDFQAAEAAGCQTILVASGRQGPQLRSLLEDKALKPPIVPDLSAAVALILDRHA